MIAFIEGLSRECVVEIVGVVSLPNDPVTGATQKVEIQLTKLFCTSRPSKELPFTVENASRGLGGSGVNQATRLDNRVLDLRTPANQAIFRIRTHIESAFKNFLISKDFDSIQTPKLLAGRFEGGAALFQLDFKGQVATLAPSAQFHKQMAICSGFNRVFNVGSYFRSEKFSTTRHLCEFVVLNVEMEIRKHYSEIMDLVDELFVFIFKHVNENCVNQLEAVSKQYPFEPVKVTY